MCSHMQGGIKYNNSAYPKSISKENSGRGGSLWGGAHFKKSSIKVKVFYSWFFFSCLIGGEANPSVSRQETVLSFVGHKAELKIWLHLEFELDTF